MGRDEVKTTLLLPKEVHKSLKRRAIDKGRPLKEIVLEAIELYLTGRIPQKATPSSSREIVDLMAKHVEGAGPEDFLEYNFSDIEG